MSRINVNNYEAFWLDYLEGNLSTEDQAEFLLFAEQNPDLEIDLSDDLIQLNELTSTELTTAEKDNLKELAELESLVVLLQDEELVDTSRLDELRSKNPEKFASLASAYEQTKLEPTSVTFPGKQELKQSAVISMYWRVAVAAAVVGLIAMIYPWNSNTVDGTVAENPSVDTSFDPLQPISPASEVAVKQFDFSNQGIETNDYEYNSSNFVANEIPKTEDSSEFEQPDLLEEDLQIAIDTTREIPTVIEDIVEEKDTISITPEVDFEENEDIAINPASKNLTVPEFLAEKVLKVEKKEEEPLIASILDQKTNWNVAYDETDSPQKKVTQFKVGKFEFYKSSKK